VFSPRNGVLILETFVLNSGIILKLCILCNVRALRGAPTFSFDGIDGSMTVIDTMIAESYPEQYFITISFECAHPDYGARATIVVVSAGEIRSAMIDGEWDEFNQHEKGASEILSSENAVNIVVRYLRENYSDASNLIMRARLSPT
jgi:hypothetical protein